MCFAASQVARGAGSVSKSTDNISGLRLKPEIGRGGLFHLWWEGEC